MKKCKSNYDEGECPHCKNIEQKTKNKSMKNALRNNDFRSLIDIDEEDDY